MAKCSKCGKSGIFFKVNTQGKCKECERIEKLLLEETEIKAQIKLLSENKIETEKSYENIKATRDTLYNQISEKAKHDALQAIQSELDSQNTKLSNIRNDIESSNNQLKEITQKAVDSEKQIVSNANKLLKIKTQFKSLQYSVKRYNDFVEIPSQILTETEADEADELLSTTIKLKLHLMDIRDLKKRYSQNNKLIKELLVKYQSRYTTKANLTIYRLMVIALEAELQNALYNLSY
jgi:chromosome segregation ATPase